MTEPNTKPMTMPKQLMATFFTKETLLKKAYRIFEKVFSRML